jgi:hypothetical protein
LKSDCYVKGMTDNVLSAGLMWNAENWWLNKRKSKTFTSPESAASK